MPCANAMQKLHGNECLKPCGGSMVEQPRARKHQHHSVFIGRGNHIIVADGAARLGNITYARLPCPFHIVAKRKNASLPTVTPDCAAIHAFFPLHSEHQGTP